MHNAKKIRKKLASLSTIIPPVHVHGETTQEPLSILEQLRFIRSLEKVLEITLQHKAVLGVQYEDQNLVKKKYTVMQSFV